MTARMKVIVDVMVLGVPKTIHIYLARGVRPSLIARTCLEEWGVVLDFRNARAMLLDDQEGK